MRANSLYPKFTTCVFVFFLVLSSSMTKLFAQKDLIKTQAGEKIRCRILEETPNRFVYAYLTPSGKILRNEIFKNLVADFKYNYYPSDIVVGGKKMAKEEKVIEKIEGKTDLPPTVTVEKPKIEKEAKKRLKKEKEVLEKVDNEAAIEKKKVEEKPKVEASKPHTPRNMSEDKPESSKEETTKEVEKMSSKKVEEEETDKVEGKAPLTDKQENSYLNHLKFRVGAKVGFSQLLQKSASTNLTEYGLYQEKLNRGWTWGADAAYFPIENFGFGLMFNNFQSSNKTVNEITYFNILTAKEEKGQVSNKRSVKFVAPVFYFRKSIDFKTMVILGIAPGAYFYKDKGNYGSTSYTANGTDYGATATLGIDFMLGNDIIGRDIILSLEAGYNYGKMRKLNYGDEKGTQTLASPIDLSRVDLTIALRFTRFPKYLRSSAY
jgi:hypothetical protein